MLNTIIFVENKYFMGVITNDDFFGFQLGGFRLGYTRGTDHLTRGLPIGGRFFQNMFSDKTEVWDTVTNNEFNLYTTTPELFIVVNKFATMFSNGVFVIKDYKTNKVIENHPLLKLLEKPNPLMNRNTWLMDIAVNYNIYGASYIHKNQGSALSEYPSILMNLPNADLSIKKTGQIYLATSIEEMIEFYRLRSTNDKIDTNEVIALKRYNSSDPCKGLSPLEALQMPLTNIRGAYGFRNVNITKRGALGLISAESSVNGTIPLNEDDRLDLERQYTKDTHGIFDGQSPVKFSNKPVKYQHLSPPIKESMVFEEISEDMLKIIDTYGLNKNIFSTKEGAKFANLAEGLRMAYQDAIIPFAELFCFALNDALGLFDKNIYVELDYSHIPVMKDNESEKATTVKTQAEALKILIENGISSLEAESIVGIKRNS